MTKKIAVLTLAAICFGACEIEEPIATDGSEEELTEQDRDDLYRSLCGRLCTMEVECGADYDYRDDMCGTCTVEDCVEVCLSDVNEVMSGKAACSQSLDAAAQCLLDAPCEYHYRYTGVDTDPLEPNNECEPLLDEAEAACDTGNDGPPTPVSGGSVVCGSSGGTGSQPAPGGVGPELCSIQWGDCGDDATYEIRCSSREDGFQCSCMRDGSGPNFVVENAATCPLTTVQNSQVNAWCGWNLDPY